MKNYFAVVFYILFISQCAYGQADFDKAKTFFQNQEYLKAFEIWDQCFLNDSTNYFCAEQAGLSAFKSGDQANAKKFFHRIEQEAGYQVSASINLANIYEYQENIPKAIKYNNFLNDTFPENPLYYRKLGNLYLKANLPAESFPYFAKALDLNPNDILSIKSISEIFIANQQYEDADSLINYGLTLDEENIGLNLLLARNYYVQKIYDSTVVVLEDLTGKIDFSNYHNRMLGYSLLQIDSVDQAIWYLEKSLVDESNPEYAHYYLANAYEIKKDLHTAMFHYNKAIKAGASDGLHTYHRNLARIQKEENQLKESIDNFQWALKYRNDPVLNLYLAQACDAYYKDKSIAINYYNKYIRSNDPNESYKKYARERVSYLKAYRHQNVNR